MPRFHTACDLLRAADVTIPRRGIPFEKIPESITKPSAIPEFRLVSVDLIDKGQSVYPSIRNGPGMLTTKAKP